METRRIVADVPVDVYMAIKMKSVTDRTELRELVAEAIRQYLGLEKGGSKGKN
jgi:hypothetical protein